MLSIQSEIEEKIKRWIAAEKWSYEIVNDPSFHFLCSISDGQNDIVFVGIEKTVDRVTIHYTAEMTAEDHQSYKLSREKYNFWFDLKISLMNMEIAAKAIPNIEELRTIDLFSMIYFDAFSQDRFIHSIIKIFDAMGLCQLMWKEFSDSQWDS